MSHPIDARAVSNLHSRRHQRLQLGQLALVELRGGHGGNLLAGLVLLLASGRHNLPVTQLLVQAESGSLLELHIAPFDVAGVRVVLSVGVDVLGEVLLLGEASPADMAHKPLEAHMERDQVALQAEPRGEFLTAVVHGTDERVGVSVLLLVGDHLVEHILQLCLLLLGELEHDGVWVRGVSRHRVLSAQALAAENSAGANWVEAGNIVEANVGTVDILARDQNWVQIAQTVWLMNDLYRVAEVILHKLRVLQRHGLRWLLLDPADNLPTDG